MNYKQLLEKFFSILPVLNFSNFKNQVRSGYLWFFFRYQRTKRCWLSEAHYQQRNELVVGQRARWQMHGRLQTSRMDHLISATNYGKYIWRDESKSPRKWCSQINIFWETFFLHKFLTNKCCYVPVHIFFKTSANKAFLHAQFK